MHVYTCQHMKVFNMQFYMIYMISRETSLCVLHIHVNCSNMHFYVTYMFEGATYTLHVPD